MSTKLIIFVLAAFSQRVQLSHDIEYTNSFNIFGASSGAGSWSDDDFTSSSVGTGNAGPDESFLRRGAQVFATREPVLSKSECESLIREAQKAIAAGSGAKLEVDLSRKDWERTNSDIGEARLSGLPPDTLNRLRSILNDRLYPMLESRYGVPDLTAYDGLILGSIAPSQSQPVHRDASLLTLNIPLSDSHDYTGGGTYIEGISELDTPLVIERGHVLCHASGVMHAGNAIKTGERWVLVIFCIARDEPQIARRCHAGGLAAFDDDNLEGAFEYFEAGLSVAPGDHLLHMGAGRVQHAWGKSSASFKSLKAAADLYLLDQRAQIALGDALMAQKRPRAALRRFDKALSAIGDRDLLDGAWMPLKALTWNARVSAATCALLCAEAEAEKSKKDMGWSRSRLPEAVGRLSTALRPCPDNGYIQSMRERAVELLRSAE
ncbi:hypothetical protein TrRE_jg4601 [Triparma retinervis]|uniref:Fe2OG dioxygenase domain-containing protein n=1 Tax=Triparma retinervis TaxID=2557542 RepID=A0A9W7C6G6_9STRA|nr:hypothetical protein TrRE_jg4601 [Triparma retinervis]